MGRSRWLLLLLIPMLFGFDTRNPFKTRGPFRTGDSTITAPFPEANGVEARITEIIAGGGIVTACSEPMNALEGGGTIPNGHNFTSSTSATGCYETRTDYTGLFATITPWSSVSTAGLDGWGSSEYVIEYGSETFLTGYRPDRIAAGEVTACWRYYIQAVGSARVGDGNCNVRHKLTQATWGPFAFSTTNIRQMQGEEDDGGSGCSYVNPINIQWDSGPLEGVEGRGSFGLESCEDKPCRIEMCVDGNIATGAGISVRMQAKRLDTGTLDEFSAGSATNMGYGPNYRDSWGMNFDHTGGGSFYFGFAASAIWSTKNTSQWIGPAVEVEGYGAN